MGSKSPGITRFVEKRNEDSELDAKVFSEGEATTRRIVDDCKKENNEWFGVIA